MWLSGKVEKGEPQIFKAIEVEGSGGRSWLRNTDSEYKMLNKRSCSKCVDLILFYKIHKFR